MGQRHKRRMICLAFLCLAFPPLHTPADAVQSVAPETTAPTPAGQALGDTTWYDAESGSVLPVVVKPVVDDSLNRDSRWLPKAKRVAKPTTPTTPNAAGGATGGTGLFGSGLTIGNLFGWMLLTAILIAAVALLVYAISKTEIDLGNDAKSRIKQAASTPDEQTIERMKHLPAELRRTDVNLRSEAERLMHAGQYDQAIILLFGHQLLLLDRAHLLRLNRGKTNGKYVRETRSVDPEAGTRLRGTVTAFERSYFGRHEIGRDEFSELWNSNLELEQAIQRRQELAA